MLMLQDLLKRNPIKHTDIWGGGIVSPNYCRQPTYAAMLETEAFILTNILEYIYRKIPVSHYMLHDFCYPDPFHRNITY